MTKAELVEKVIEETGLKKADAARATNAVFAAITNEVKAGGSIRVPGFGSFSCKEVAERTGRNIRTGEPIQIAAHKKMAFKSSKDLSNF